MPTSLASQLDQALVDDLRRIAQVAADHGLPAYLVGGVPRDLVLGIPPGNDLDVVLEGDALPVASDLAARYGGQARLHDRFGTANWLPPDGKAAIDLITARAETYARPGALPLVRSGTLDDDLARRDFTINTLAMDLSPAAFGALVDPFGAVHDLTTRVIRALHPSSFQDDPTRMLRAARYAVRLGFALDPDTAHWLADSLPVLSRVTGRRLHNELLRIFAEPNAAAVLDLLESLGILAAIHPQLLAGADAAMRLELLAMEWQAWPDARVAISSDRASGTHARPTEPDAAHRMAAWLVGVAFDAELLASIGRRLDLSGAEIKRLRQARQLAGEPSLAADNATGSAVYRAVMAVSGPHRPSLDTLLLAWIAAAKQARDEQAVQRNLRRFAGDLAHARPLIGGDDLGQLGIPAGPRYRELLTAVHHAQLDGAVTTREAALALVQELAELTPRAEESESRETSE